MPLLPVFLRGVSGFGLMLLVYGLLIEPSQLKIRQVEFSSPKYTGPKIRIALLTDLHINGLHVPPSRVLDIVDVVNAQNPDIVLLPGDFVSGHEKAENRSAEFNKKLGIGVSHLEHILQNQSRSLTRPTPGKHFGLTPFWHCQVTLMVDRSTSRSLAGA